LGFLCLKHFFILLSSLTKTLIVILHRCHIKLNLDGSIF
jgi:hypothetical protein